MFRTTASGLPVDSSGTMSLDGVSKMCKDAVGLIGLLAKSAEVRRCFATDWFRFALLRPAEANDLYSIESVSGAYKSETATLQDLMVAIATARSFRYREPSPGEMP